MPLNIGTDCTVDMWINPSALPGTIIWSNNSDTYASGPTPLNDHIKLGSNLFNETDAVILVDLLKNN